jgi:hypothetical protein
MSPYIPTWEDQHAPRHAESACSPSHTNSLIFDRTKWKLQLLDAFGAIKWNECLKFGILLATMAVSAISATESGLRVRELLVEW